MKRFVELGKVVLVLILALVSASTVGAQRFSTRIYKFSSGSETQALNDFWFCIPQNYESQGEKTYDLYITSPAPTQIHIQRADDPPSDHTIDAKEVLTLRMPLEWEITSSGVVERKSVHVWSDGAPLSVYTLSRNPAASDGMSVIASALWGTDNVVASFHSIARSASWDYPSEFTVTANAPSQLRITPTQDIRANGKPEEVLHARGIEFTEKLERGDAVQYQLTKFQNASEWDATGTTVLSTTPVGVAGASQCPDLPVLYPWCDHIVEMMPPLRLWGKRYYTAPFYAQYGGDGILVIASTEMQTIYKTDIKGKRIHAVLHKYEPRFVHDVEFATKWESEQPFLVVQYINSTSWPGPSGGIPSDKIGDPAMVVIPPIEAYTSNILFQTPTIKSGAKSFTNFASVFVPRADSATTFLDDQVITTFSRDSLDAEYDAYQVKNLSPGVHGLTSPGKVAATIYGYGSYDSYAWPASYGPSVPTKPAGKEGESPYVVAETQSCECLTVKLRDGAVGTPGLVSSKQDSLNNLSLTMLAEGKDSILYRLCVIDSALGALARILVRDRDDNLVGFEHAFSAPNTSLDVAGPALGIPEPNETAYGSLRIENVGTIPYDMKLIALANGKSGFTLSNTTPKTIASGGIRSFGISFSASSEGTYRDTLLVGEDCFTNRYPLEIIVRPASITLKGAEFVSSAVGAAVAHNRVEIANNSHVNPLKIVEITSDRPEFVVMAPSTPFTIDTMRVAPLLVQYTPTTTERLDARLLVKTEQSSFAIDVVGRIGSSSVTPVDELALEGWLNHEGPEWALFQAPSPNPAYREVTLRWAQRAASRITLTAMDMSGREVMRLVDGEMRGRAIQEARMDVTGLAAGRYLVQLISAEGACSVPLNIVK